MKRLLYGLGFTVAFCSLAIGASMPQAFATNNVVFGFPNSGSTVRKACDFGTNYNNLSLHAVFTITNNCSVRVWLHQYDDWQTMNGNNQCFSPGDSYLIDGPLNPFKNLYISSNKSDC